MLSGTRRSGRSPWCGDADLIFNTMLVFSSFVLGGTRNAAVQLCGGVDHAPAEGAK